MLIENFSTNQLEIPAGQTEQGAELVDSPLHRNPFMTSYNCFIFRLETRWAHSRTVWPMTGAAPHATPTTAAQSVARPLNRSHSHRYASVINDSFDRILSLWLRPPPPPPPPPPPVSVLCGAACVTHFPRRSSRPSRRPTLHRPSGPAAAACSIAAARRTYHENSRHLTLPLHPLQPPVVLPARSSPISSRNGNR